MGVCVHMNLVSVSEPTKLTNQSLQKIQFSILTHVVKFCDFLLIDDDVHVGVILLVRKKWMN